MASRLIKTDADVIKKLEAVSLVPVGGSAEQFATVIRKDAAIWADVAKAGGVKGE